MKVKRLYEYDVKHNNVMGPFDQMQVVMARGIFSPWKQPIFVAFDTKITTKFFDNIALQLFSIGYNVKACVSDMGGGNIGLWKELQINTEKTGIAAFQF